MSVRKFCLFQKFNTIKGSLFAYLSARTYIYGVQLINLMLFESAYHINVIIALRVANYKNYGTKESRFTRIPTIL